MKQHIVKACSLLWLFTVCFTSSASVLPLNKQLYLAFDNDGPNYFRGSRYGPGVATPRVIGGTSVIKISPYSFGGGKMAGLGSVIKTVGLVGDYQGPKCAIKTYMPDRPEVVNTDICRLCQLGLVRQYNNKKIFRTGESSGPECGDSSNFGGNDVGAGEVNITGENIAGADMVDADGSIIPGAVMSSDTGIPAEVEIGESANNIAEANADGDGTYGTASNMGADMTGGNSYQEGGELRGPLISRQGGYNMNGNYGQNNMGAGGMGGNAGMYNGGSSGGGVNVGGRGLSGRGTYDGGVASRGRGISGGINAGASFSGGSSFGGGASFGAGNVGGGKGFSGGGNIGGGASIGGAASIGAGANFGAGNRGNSYIGGGGGNMGAGAGIYGGANIQGSAGIQGGTGVFGGGKGIGGSGGIKGKAQIGGGASIGMHSSASFNGGTNMYGRSRFDDRFDNPDAFDNTDRFDSPDRFDNNDNFDRFENVDRLDNFDLFEADDRIDIDDRDIARIGSFLGSLSDNIMLHGGITNGGKHYGFGFGPKNNPFSSIVNRGHSLMGGLIGRSGIDHDELNSIEIATDSASISEEDDEDHEVLVGTHRHGIEDSHESKYEHEAHMEDFDGFYDVDSVHQINEQENSYNIVSIPEPETHDFGLG